VREQVARRELAAKGAEPDAALVAFFAARPAESVRVLVAQLQRVLNAAEARHVAPTVELAREVLDGVTPSAAPEEAPAAPPRRSGSNRVSGIVAPTAGGARSREKMVWEWPEVSDRLIEDWR
jgi:phosphohistidine phosphatase SixA